MDGLTRDWELHSKLRGIVSFSQLGSTHRQKVAKTARLPRSRDNVSSISHIEFRKVDMNDLLHEALISFFFFFIWTSRAGNHKGQCGMPVGAFSPDLSPAPAIVAIAPRF